MTSLRYSLSQTQVQMKTRVFNELVEEVTSLFDVSEEELFTKTKKRRIVEARYALYYMCHKRKMPIIYIQEFMGDNGYSIEHPTVIYGIKQISKRVRTDPDYKAIKR